MKRKKNYTRWNHTAQEKRIIKKKGGKPLKKYGTDGTLRGRPVEVRSARKDNRYRIQKNTHQSLVRRKGSYIFVKPGETKTIPAQRVSRMMGGGPWFKDRDYPHKFVKKKDVFGDG